MMVTAWMMILMLMTKTRKRRRWTVIQILVIQIDKPRMNIASWVGKLILSSL